MMMGNRIFLMAILPCVISACDGSQLRRIHASQESQEALAILEADTAYLIRREAQNSLVWITRVNQRRVTRWRSGSLYYGLPQVSLTKFNGDSIPDLFWTMRYEEILEGSLLLGTQIAAREAFSVSDSSCSVPQMRDVTDDGQMEILEYVAGALSPEECLGDAWATACQKRFPTEWVRVWVLEEGEIEIDREHSKSFYASLAEDYETASKELGSMLAQDPAEIPSPRCNMEMVKALDELALRAHAIAQSN